MPKFKVGDKVILVDASHGWGRAKKGDKGVIKKILAEYSEINGEVIYDVGVTTHSTYMFWTGSESCFMLAESPESEEG